MSAVAHPLENSGGKAVLSTAAENQIRRIVIDHEAAGFLVAGPYPPFDLVQDVEWIERHRGNGALSPSELIEMNRTVSAIRAVPGRQIIGLFRTCRDAPSTPGLIDTQLGEHYPEGRLLVIASVKSNGRSELKQYYRDSIGGWVPHPAHSSARSWQRRLGFAAVVLIAALLSGGITWMVLRPASATLLKQSTDLGLRVQVDGPSLRITWNRDHPALRDAREGWVRITDGSSRREIAISGAELSGGSILYRPMSDETLFSLEVRKADDTLLMETVRVLDGLKASVNPQEPIVPRLLRQDIPIQPKPASPQPPAQTAGISQPPAAQPSARPFVWTPRAADPVPAERSLLVPPPSQTVAPMTTAVIPLAPPPNVPPPAPPEVKVQVQVPVKSVVAGAVQPPQQPTVPPRALRQVRPVTRIQGTSMVREAFEMELEASIDTSGRVTDVRVISGADRAGVYLTREAVEAARNWTFEPARAQGHPVPGFHRIVFRFKPGQ